MVLLFNQRVPLVAVLELALACLVFCASFMSAVAGHSAFSQQDALVVAAAVGIFALGQILCLGAFRLHRMDRSVSATAFALRILGSLAAGSLLVYGVFAMFPDGAEYRAALPEALLLSAAGLLLVRLVLVFGVEMVLLYAIGDEGVLPL